MNLASDFSLDSAYFYFVCILVFLFLHRIIECHAHSNTISLESILSLESAIYRGSS